MKKIKLKPLDAYPLRERLDLFASGYAIKHGSIHRQDLKDAFVAGAMWMKNEKRKAAKKGKVRR